MACPRGHLIPVPTRGRSWPPGRPIFHPVREPARTGPHGRAIRPPNTCSACYKLVGAGPFVMGPTGRGGTISRNKLPVPGYKHVFVLGSAPTPGKRQPESVPRV